MKAWLFSRIQEALRSWPRRRRGQSCCGGERRQGGGRRAGGGRPRAGLCLGVGVGVAGDGGDGEQVADALVLEHPRLPAGRHLRVRHRVQLGRVRRRRHRRLLWVGSRRDSDMQLVWRHTMNTGLFIRSE